MESSEGWTKSGNNLHPLTGHLMGWRSTCGQTKVSQIQNDFSTLQRYSECLAGVTHSQIVPP